jgi:signal transduction histidine kinase
LEIDYIGLSLVAPEKMQFRVKLEGQDNDWRVPTDPRHSHYTNLRPAKYRFHVIASNNSGVWNEQGDSLEFSIAPAYYETNWFRALCVLAFLTLLWTAYQHRVRRLQHDFEMTLDGRVAERTRIARDLHDTLLQSFQVLLLHLQVASQLLPERPIEAKSKLDRTLDQAESAVTEGRDAVRALRASTFESNDLARAISMLGEELKAASNNAEPQLRLTVEGESRDLHPIIRDETYKIAAEALRNAFRHSHAQQIEVEIRYEREQFRLRVRDDGKGIDTAVLSGTLETEGHYGIRGMRERASVIGGKLVVRSEIDAGTEIELRVPGGTAYAKRGGRSLLSRRLSTKAKV